MMTPPHQQQVLTCPSCGGGKFVRCALDAVQNIQGVQSVSAYVRKADVDYSTGYFSDDDASQSCATLSALCANCQEIVSYSIQVDEHGAASFEAYGYGKFDDENHHKVMVL